MLFFKHFPFFNNMTMWNYFILHSAEEVSGVMTPQGENVSPCLAVLRIIECNKVSKQVFDVITYMLHMQSIHIGKLGNRVGGKKQLLNYFYILLLCLVLSVFPLDILCTVTVLHPLLSPFTSQRTEPGQRISQMKDDMLACPVQLSNTLLPGWFRNFILPLIKQQRIYWQQMGEQCFSEKSCPKATSLYILKKCTC